MFSILEGSVDEFLNLDLDINESQTNVHIQDHGILLK